MPKPPDEVPSPKSIGRRQADEEPPLTPPRRQSRAQKSADAPPAGKQTAPKAPDLVKLARRPSKAVSVHKAGSSDSLGDAQKKTTAAPARRPSRLPGSASSEQLAPSTTVEGEDTTTKSLSMEERSPGPDPVSSLVAARKSVRNSVLAPVPEEDDGAGVLAMAALDAAATADPVTNETQEEEGEVWQDGQENEENETTADALPAEEVGSDAQKDDEQDKDETAEDGKVDKDEEDKDEEDKEEKGGDDEDKDDEEEDKEHNSAEDGEEDYKQDDAEESEEEDGGAKKKLNAQARARARTACMLGPEEEEEEDAVDGSEGEEKDDGEDGEEPEDEEADEDEEEDEE